MKFHFNLAWVICLITLPVTAKIIYVDDDAIGANDGTSWINAYVTLQDALMEANATQKPAEINVGQGIYKPGQGENRTGGIAPRSPRPGSNSNYVTTRWARVITDTGPSPIRRIPSQR